MFCILLVIIFTFTTWTKVYHIYFPITLSIKSINKHRNISTTSMYQFIDWYRTNWLCATDWIRHKCVDCWFCVPNFAQ